MTRRRQLILVVLSVLALAVLWQQVFVMTGVLWWNAPTPGEKLPAFETLRLPPVDIHLVNLDDYLAAHPEWRPR
jgi:hypothetical protein